MDVQLMMKMQEPRWCLKVVLTMAMLLLLIGSQLFAQPQPSTFVPVAPEVLSNSFVRCIYKDSNGYVWIGTAEGLIRYDGANVVKYEHNPVDHSSIPHNLINVIAEDVHKTLWIGTGRGLIKFNRELDNFINVDSIPGTVNNLSSRFITAITFDQLGHLWIGTHGNGINVYNPKALTFKYLFDTADKHEIKSSEFVTSILSKDDLIWCATKGGVELYNATTKARADMVFRGDTIADGEVSQIARDNAGNIWLATATGDIVKVTEGNGYYRCKTIVKGANLGADWAGIRDLSADGKGNFWVAGENIGLNYLDTRSGALTRYVSGSEQWGNLPTKSILSVYVDNAGLTWIGTTNQGAFLIDDNSKKFNMHHIANSAGHITRGIAEDPHGKIWLAYEGIGIATLDVSTKNLEYQNDLNKRLPNKFFTSLICDRNGNLWASTSGNGVYKFNIETRRLESFAVKSNGLGDNKLYCLYEDKEGKIWAGSAGSGLFYFDVYENKFTVLAEEKLPNHIPPTIYITSILEDSHKVLWIGTLFGIYTISPDSRPADKYKWYGQEGPGTLSSNGIQTIFEDRSKNIWVATSDNGLNVKWNGEEKFQTFRKNDGLISNTIRGLATDGKGNLWVSTNMGISKFDINTHSFTNYSRTDGLTSNNFSENAALRTTQGLMFFGNNNGFNSFYADSLIHDRSKPVVYLSDLKINNETVKIGDARSPLNKHISLTSSIELDYQQRSFSINFGALNYARGPRYSYCYMLEGFDTDWNCVSANLSATYTNIDPGQYVFLVKASNGNGVWSSEPTKLVINIEPAPWYSWWAILIYCTVLALISYFLIRFRVERIRIKTELKIERKARERERELIESKTMFFTNVSHEFRTPLSLILLPLETLMTSVQIPSSIRNKIAIAHKSAEKMMNLVNELMDFNKAESGTLQLYVMEGDIAAFVQEVAISFRDLALKRNVRFKIVPEVSALHGFYDARKLEKIIFNLLSNAFKFTADGGEIQMIINERQASLSNGEPRRCLELIIIDNGIGIESDEITHIFDKFYQAKSALKIANPGTGVGLSLTKALVELHGGNITALSAAGVTKFTVTLPVENLSTQRSVMETTSGALSEHTVSEVSNEQPQILLVEDNTELREYLASELRSEFVVYESADGLAGLDIAREKVPDLIISDILMANKSGLELCKTLKADIKTCHIPIILLTAKASIEEQIMGIESGADVYMTKPFNYQYLVTQVRNIVDSRRKLYAHFSKNVYLLPAKIATNELDQEFLQCTIDYIVEHLQDTQLGVDSIADSFKLSRVQVYRKIKALTGRAVVEFIRSVRLKRALELMETKRFTLSEVAYRTGFNSASYFSRSFKEEYGKSPSEFASARKKDGRAIPD